VLSNFWAAEGPPLCSGPSPIALAIAMDDPTLEAPGKKMTLELADLAMACIASRYLICIAGAEERISAACLISLADSTSARAAMTFDSPIRLDWAAIERESCNSLLKMISLMSMLSTCTPHPDATSSMISPMD